MSASTYSGKVKFFNDIKGYGFVTDLVSLKDYFFHFSGIIDKVRKDDKVNFELQEGPRGLKAINIKLQN